MEAHYFDTKGEKWHFTVVSIIFNPLGFLKVEEEQLEMKNTVKVKCTASFLLDIFCHLLGDIPSLCRRDRSMQPNRSFSILIAITLLGKVGSVAAHF